MCFMLAVEWHKPTIGILPHPPTIHLDGMW